MSMGYEGLIGELGGGDFNDMHFLSKKTRGVSLLRQV